MSQILNLNIENMVNKYTLQNVYCVIWFLFIFKQHEEDSKRILKVKSTIKFYLYSINKIKYFRLRLSYNLT